MTDLLDLPDDGVVTRAVFESLPRVPRRWAWELHGGRLHLAHLPINTVWRSRTVIAVVEHWLRLGHEASGSQYVADPAFLGMGGHGPLPHTVVATDAVIFAAAVAPDLHTSVHAVPSVHAVLCTVAGVDEDRDTTARMARFASLAIPHCWVAEQLPDAAQDTAVWMYELDHGVYRRSGEALLSQLAQTDAS